MPSDIEEMATDKVEKTEWEKNIEKKIDRILENVEETNKDVTDMKKRVTHIENFEKDVTNLK